MSIWPRFAHSLKWILMKRKSFKPFVRFVVEVSATFLGSAKHMVRYLAFTFAAMLHSGNSTYK